MILSCVTKDQIRFILEFSDSLLEQNQIKNLIQYFIFVLIMVGYIIKIENLPTIAGEKTDMLIGFNVVGLAKNAILVMNLSNF